VLATGGLDNTVRLWDPQTGPLGKPLTGHTDPVRWAAWGRLTDRPVLATGGQDNTVRLWDPQTGLLEATVGYRDAVLWGAWAGVDDRPVLATGGQDGTVRLWEAYEERSVGRRPYYYRSDNDREEDRLGRIHEATALAELITSGSATPPMAVGLFGEWGEGKSHFLNLLMDRVNVSADRKDSFTHNNVRQVRFNAWHYAETDLWASLVAEMFGQLARSDNAPDVASEQASAVEARRRDHRRTAASGTHCG
jgi:KAP family P-loop domain/WD domain, G-beta repeat